MSNSWYNDERPTNINDMFNTSPIITNAPELIKNTLSGKRSDGIPSNMLFYADVPGVGKTTLALLLACSLNPHLTEKQKSAILNMEKNDICFYYNGVDASKKDDMRDVVKIMKNLKYSLDNKANYIFIYDEIHKLSTDSKEMLLSALEFSPKNVFFIGTTTDKTEFFKSTGVTSNLEKALESRFMVYKFLPLTKPKMDLYLTRLAKKREFSIPEEILDVIYDKSKGSIREGIQQLQYYFNHGQLEETSTTDDINVKHDIDAIFISLVLPKAGEWFSHISLIIVKILNGKLVSPEKVLEVIESNCFNLLVDKLKLEKIVKNYIKNNPNINLMFDDLFEIGITNVRSIFENLKNIDLYPPKVKMINNIFSIYSRNLERIENFIKKELTKNSQI